MVADNKGRVLAATWTGKVKTCVQIGGIIIIYLYYIFGWALFSGTTGLSFETGDSIAYTLFILLPFTPAMIISRRTGI